ncbi:MAG TPA: hypothetical protein P5572_19265 [Phycisphaerae bacterium]|nr:hypothetical protein [Phycisphaerales bacterium]HRX87172.1 hypothetical protein [Phycisphaerae bacterium]
MVSRCSILSGLVFFMGAAGARADAFSAYAVQRSFQLPAGASSFDVLADGRIVTMVDANVYTENATGSATFGMLGTLPDADVVPGAYATGFVRVSPDGTRIAVGNNGGATFDHPQVGVFALDTLAGSWFTAAHYDAAWLDNRSLALTAGDFSEPSRVTLLDTQSAPGSPTNPTIIANIDGGSAGITFDAAGYLYTGNGFDFDDTGVIKAFSPAAWQPALSGASPADFEAAGDLIAEVLSAGALGFDAEGNLHVGGGDFAEDESDFAALIRANDVLAARAGGGGADVNNPTQVRRFDPDSGNPFNFYDVNFNPVTGELYLREGTTVYSYVAPEPSGALFGALGALAVMRRRSQTRSAA